MPDSTLFEAIESTSDKDELEKIIASAQARRDEVMKQHRQEIKQQIRELAASADLGVDLWELSADGKKAKSKKKYGPTNRPAKYRNLDNPDETWHGHGPRPNWLNKLIEAGRKQEEFLIPGMK
jgi:DNA-binding protein H-NS